MISQQQEETLRAFVQRERLIRQTSQRIRQSLSLDQVLNTAVTEVRQILKTDRVILYRFNPDWSGDVVVESVGSAWKSILGEKYEDNCLQDNQAINYRQGRVCSMPDIYDFGLTPCHINLLEDCQVKANLIVPVMQGEKLWGLLLAHHCQSTREWQETEIDLLQQISTQIAITIQQAALFEKVEAELEERKRTEIALLRSESQLKEKAAELEKTLKELRETQAQLIQSEKMSSLGQLVAGVAHEINNPVSFISGNIAHVSNYTEDLLNLFKIYQQHYPEPDHEIQDYIEKIDLAFISEDFPKVISSMKIGTTRIQQIVESLRNFSRLDEAEQKKADLHEGINNALMILQHRFHNKTNSIKLVKEYGKLPEIECYPRQLNQVFINLINNAVDALEAVADQLHFSPQITISTAITERLGKNYALVQIQDNGIGISSQVKEQIFDPFFSTKPIGKGTGLGLSISYKIVVERHQGQLECHSSSQGTEFIILIPYL